MTINKINPIVKTSFLIIIFYLLFIISRTFRIAPSIISMLMPFGILFLKKGYSVIYSVVLIILINISGFVVESIGIFLLFMVPVLIYNTFQKKVVRHSLITIFSVISFFIMYYFFGYLLHDFFLRNNLTWLLLLLYIVFANLYGFLLNRLKKEIENFVKKEEYK